MGKIRKIAAHYVYTPQGFLRNGVITIDESNTIIEVSARENTDRMPNVEFYNGILIPGMVNAHTHLELSYLKGKIEPGRGFRAFAEGMREQRNRSSLQERQAAAEYYDAKMWADGISVVADICNGPETFGIKRNSRIKYHSFIEMYGLACDSADEAIKLRNMAEQQGLSATITPHSTYSLNRKAFALAVGGSENNLLSIHFMESRQEEQLFRGEGELTEWYGHSGFNADFIGKYGSPADRIVKEIPADRQILFVHNTFVEDEIIKIIRKYYGDRATWVVCPASNMYINRMKPPVEVLRKAGVKMAVGTDSLASNRHLSIIEEMKITEGVPLEEMLEWATINGAKALGMDAEFGSLETGKKPGIVQLTGVDMEKMALTENAQTNRLV